MSTPERWMWNAVIGIEIFLSAAVVLAIATGLIAAVLNLLHGLHLL